MADIIKKFNDNVVSLLTKIMNKAPEQVQNIQYYCLDLSEYPERVGVRLFKDLDNDKIDNKYLNYYWVKFSFSGKDYRLNMFYRDFDRGSGNIHVLPGLPQLWIRENNNPYDGSDYVIIEHTVSYTQNDIIEYSCSRGKPYKELHWSPIVPVTTFSRDIHMVWNENSIDEIANNFWKDFSNENGFTGCVEGKNSNVLYLQELKDCIYKECAGKFGRKTYGFLKWKDNPNETMTAYYKMLYVDDGYFCIYDGEEHKLSLKNNKKGSNYLIPIDGGYQWKIDYTELK